MTYPRPLLAAAIAALEEAHRLGMALATHTLECKDCDTRNPEAIVLCNEGVDMHARYRAAYSEAEPYFVIAKGTQGGTA